MKKVLSLIITFVMLVNLTGEVFGQSIPGFTSPKGNYFPETEQYSQNKDKLSQELAKQHQAQAVASSIGLSYEKYKEQVAEYAKKNKIDINNIDVDASWRAYSREVFKYNSDYQALIKIFAKKTYLEVLTEAKSFIGEKGNIVSYQGKKYNKVAIYHAALHNLATRTLSGYTQNSTFVFGSESNKEFNIKEKVAVMDFIYRVISNDGFYPKDQEALYKMAKEVVREGKEYFKSTKEHNDEAHDAKGVVAAISVLTALSNTSAKKQESAQVIYALSKSVMRKDLGAMGILSGSEALLTLNTEDSLNKLYTLLAEDLYRGWGTELVMFVTETFSIEELQQRLAGFTSELNNGLGQYHNAIARRYVYVDPNKNSYDQKRLAESRDETLANYSKVIYTDIFEEIGKEIGRRTKDPKVAKLASRFANKYYSELNAAKQNTAEPQKNASGFITAVNNKTAILSRADSPLKRETKIHTSLIVGILSTTKQKEENLTKAARVIYNGNWWDINEITQRDKNNAAAKYLNLQRKPFNQRKQDMYALVIRTKNTAKFVDVFAQAAMLGQMVVSMPAMIGRVSNWAKNISKWFKVEAKPAGVAKPVVAKPVEVKPVVKSAPAKPVEIKPVEAKPIEVKPIEVKPLEMPKVAPKVVEPVKVPVFAEPIKVPAAQVAKVTPEVAQSQVTAIAREVKYDILGKYYQRPAAMSVLPFGLSGISKRLSFFLTGRVYLSETKIAKVKAIVDEAAKSLIPEITEGKIPQAELRNSLLDRTFAKIQESADFTAEEKADLFRGKKIYPEVKAAEPAPEMKISKEQAAKAKQYIKKAKEAFDSGKTEKALDYCDTAIELDPSKAEYYLQRGEILYDEDAGNFEEALEDFNKAIELDPSKAEYYLSRGHMLALEQTEKALADFNKAIELEPNNASYYDARSEFKWEYLQDEQGALDDINKAIELEPNYGPYYADRGWMKKWINLKDYKGALKDYDKAVELTRDDYYIKLREDFKAEVKEIEAKAAEPAPEMKISKEQAAKAKQYIKEAEKAFNSGKTEKALDYCDTAIELDPSKAEYYLQRGEILYDEDAGNFEEALEDFNKAIELDPSKAEYYLSRGHMLALEQTEKALADFNKAIELEPNNASYYDARSEFKWEYLQDRQGALDDINKAIELEPNYGPYYADRGWMKWINLKDYKGALKDYDKAVELTRKEDDYYIKLREDFKAEVIEAKAGDNVSAQQIVGESKVPANITPEVVARQKAKKHFKKYRKAYREHNIEEAYNNINEAIKYDPENAAYYHERAMLEYYNFENYMAGMEDMKMAHKLDPKNSRYGYILEERWGKELAAKETTKVPAKTEAEQTEVQQIAKQVKSDILNKYNDNTLMMSFFPTGFLGKIGKRVKAFLTNKPYLSEAKIKIVRNIVDDVAKEFEGKNIPEAELKAKINEQVAQRIKLDTRFTEAEKIEVLKEYQTRPVKIEKGKAGEYYEMALKNKKLGYKQQAYDYFEKAINTETRKSVKAQYSIEQARFLRYAKGTGREKINLRNTKGRAISYNEAALKSYDRAVEYATGKVKAKYLLERADFKRYNADFEGAKTDTELAKKLDPTIAK